MAHEFPVDTLESVRLYKRRDELGSLLIAAQADAQRIIAHVVAVYRPKRVWQWGSLVDTGHSPLPEDQEREQRGEQEAH
jgi:hypothetical protein